MVLSYYSFAVSAEEGITKIKEVNVAQHKNEENIELVCGDEENTSYSIIISKNVRNTKGVPLKEDKRIDL